MALCHFKYNTITRSKGMSLMSHIAYILRAKLTDARSGMTFDYTGKGSAEVVVCCPDNAPEWMKDISNIEAMTNFFESEEDKILSKKYKDKDKREKMISSAQMAQTIEFSLQNELSREQNIEIVNNYIKENFTSRGLVAVYAIHWENGQPHVHIVVYGRSIVQGQELSKSKVFNSKDKELGFPLFSREGMNYLRKSYVDVSNLILKKYGHEVQLDHRSYKDRGLDLVATKHVGVYGSKYLKNGEQSEIALKNADIRRENFIKMLNDPSILIKKVAQERTVFTKADLMGEIFKLVEGDDVNYIALSQKVNHYMDSSLPMSFGKEVVGSNVKFDSSGVLLDIERKADMFLAKVIGGEESLVSAGESIVGEAVYTSKDRIEYERDTEARIRRMVSRDLIGHLDQGVVNKQLAVCSKEDGFSNYSKEQLLAIGGLTSGGQLQVLKGRAGTGKTTVLKPIVRAYEEAGYRVIGCSFQSRVQEQLQRDVGMTACTIDALFKRWDEYDKLVDSGLNGSSGKYVDQKLARFEPWQLNDKSVLVIDEGAMVEFDKMAKLLKRADQIGAKVICLQDRKQIKAVYGQDISGMVEKHVRRDIELTENHRQKIGWMKEASTLANDHRFSESLLMYDDHGLVRYAENFEEAKEFTLNDFIKLSGGNATGDNYIITKRNIDNSELNKKVYGFFKDKGLFGESHNITITDYITGAKETLEFSIGCKIVLRQNDNNYHTKILDEQQPDIVGIKDTAGRGISNGSFGVVEHINPKSNLIQIRLQDNRLVEFDYTKYDKFNYGWSITENNSQGMSDENAVYLGSKYSSSGDWVVGLTRHKQKLVVVLSKEDFPNIASVDKVIRGDNLTLALDYNVSESDKKYYDKIARYKQVSASIGNIYNQIETTALEYETRGKAYDKSLHPAWRDFNDRQRQQKDLAISILDSWEYCKEFASSSNVSLRDLQAKAGVGEKLFTAVELQAINVVDEYFRTSIAVTKLRKEIQLTHPVGLMEEHQEYGRYASLCKSRDAMAYGINENLSLYKPFFKLSYEFENKREEKKFKKSLKSKDKAQSLKSKKNKNFIKGNIVAYNTQWTSFDTRPPSIKSLTQHAKLFAESNSEQKILNRLSDSDKIIFEDMLVYKDSMRVVGSSYHGINEINKCFKGKPTTIATPNTVAKLEEQYKDACSRRDMIAYKIIDNYTSGGSLNNKDFEGLLSLVGGVDEVKFLRHAYMGNLRNEYNNYLSAFSIDERLESARNLYKLCLNRQDKMNKSAYGLLTEIGCDVARLKFENGYAVSFAWENKRLYSTIAELESGFSSIRKFKELNSECSEQWNIVKVNAVNYAEDLQVKYLEQLHAKGVATGVTYEILKAEAINSLETQRVSGNTLVFEKKNGKYISSKALTEVNDNVLSYTAERLKVFAKASGDVTSSYGDIVSANSSLGSYAGISELNNLSGNGESLANYNNAIEERDKFSHDLHSDITADKRYKLAVADSNLVSLKKISQFALNSQVRELARKYTSQDTLEDRYIVGEQLSDLVLDKNDKLNKQVYGLLVQEGIDVDKLKFEQASALYTVNPYSNISELESDYSLVARFKELNKECGKLVSDVKEDISLSDQLNIVIVDRDNYSRELLANINNDDRLKSAIELSGLVKIASLEKYTKRAELRDICNNYLSQEALDSRLESAVELYTKIADEHGKISKSTYGLVRSVGVDIDRLKFEQLYVEKLPKIDSSLVFKNLAEFNNSYPVIKDYFVHHNTCGRLWHKMVDDGKSIVTGFCKSHLELLQEQGVATDLTYDDLVSGAKEYVKEQRAIELKAQKEEYVKTGKKSYLTPKDKLEYRYVLTKLQEFSSGLDNKQIEENVSSLKKFDAGLNKGYMRWVNVHTAHRGEKVYNEWLDNYQKKLPYAYDLIDSRGRLLESIYDEKIFERILKEANIYANKNNLTVNYSCLGQLGNSNLSSDNKLPRINYGESNLRETIGGDNDYTISSNTSVATGNVRNGLQQNNSLNNKTTTRSLSKHELDSLCTDVCRSVDVERLVSSISNSFVLNKSASNSSQLRYGRKGALVINKDSGLWTDFATGDGGTLIKFVQNELGTSFKDSLSYMQPYVTGDVSARIDSFLGNKTDIVIDHDKLEQLREESKKQVEIREEQQQEINQAKILSAQELYNKSVSIEGTQVEQYLISRGINPDHAHHHCIRYIPAGTEFSYNGEIKKIYNGAMLSTNDHVDGSLYSIEKVQLTYLEDGKKQLRKDGSVLAKLQYGVGNGLVSLSDNDLANTVIISEGVETALSVKEAIYDDKTIDNTAIDIYASNGVSGLANIADRNYENVIICGDYDGVGAKSTEKTEQVAQDLREQGINVSVIYPSPDENYPDKKLDFNDVLQQEDGKQIIKDSIEGELSKVHKRNTNEQEISTLSGIDDKEIVKTADSVNIINEELTVNDNNQKSLIRGNNTADLEKEKTVSLRDSVGEAQVAGESERERSLPSENQLEQSANDLSNLTDSDIENLSDKELELLEEQLKKKYESKYAYELAERQEAMEKSEAIFEDTINDMEKEYQDKKVYEENVKNLEEIEKGLDFIESLTFNNVKKYQETIKNEDNQQPSADHKKNYEVDCYEVSKNDELMSVLSKVNTELHAEILDSAKAGKEESIKREKELSQSYGMDMGF